jgi:ferrous iron transport protein B
VILTSQAYAAAACKKKLSRAASADRVLISLAGNPNTGKSTLFNALTGLKQHTGNWPGKTVLKAEGRFVYRDREFIIVDLPGTYSLLANSAEEQVARDFICFNCPDVTVVVTDAACLERNLNLVLQVLEMTSKVVVCVNMVDEAERKRIRVDTEVLSKELGVPVAATSARYGRGLRELLDKIYDLATGAITTSPRLVTYNPEVEKIVSRLEPRLRSLLPKKLSPRWVALRLIDGEHSILEALNNYLGEDLNAFG